MTELARPEVVLGGDDGPFQRALSRAETALTAAGARFERAGGRLSASITVPLLAIGTAAARATASWETAMKGVQKTVDGTAEEINALGGSLKGLSERIPVAANELADIAAEAGQLGIALSNLGGFTEVVAGLQVATNLGDQAASSLARLANVMGTSQTDFDRMGSTIVDLGNNLATTEAEIVQMALRIAGAGKQIGLTEADVLAFAGALSSVGIQAEAGGTAISRVMVDIAQAVETGSDSLRGFAKVAGVSTDEFSRAFRADAAGAIAQFVQGLSTLEDRGGSVFAVLDQLGLADVRVRDALLRASAGSEILSESLRRGSQAWQDNTALTKEAASFYDRLAARGQVLLNKLRNITAELGDALRPAFDQMLAIGDQVANVFRGLVAEFAKLDPQLRAQAGLWAAVAAAIGPLVLALGTALTLFGSVIAAVAQVGVAIAGLGLVIVAIKNNWLGMGDAAATAWDTILAVASRAISGIFNVVKPFANFLIGFFVGVANSAVQSWGIIRYEFGRAFDWIREKATSVLMKVAEGIGLLGRAGRILAYEIQNALSGGNVDWEEEGTAVGRRIADGFADAFSTDYVGAFVGFVQEGVNRARAFIASAIEKLRGMMGGGVAVPELEEAQIALEGVGETINSVTSRGTAGFDLMAESLLAARDIGIDFAIAFGDAVGDAVTDGIAAFKRFGEYVLKTLVSVAAKFAIFKGLSAIFPGSGFIGGLGKALGFAGGFATGGTIPAGQWGIVGERGPEIVHGPANVSPGTGVPANVSAGTGVTVNVPPARDPITMARDQQWVRAVMEAFRVGEDNGFRPATP